MADSVASAGAPKRRVAFWLVLLAAGGVFAVTMGARQSMGLFLSVINSTTGLGLASISLAFGVGQLWWGLTQPAAGILADRYGAGRVLLLGLTLVAIGTALVPLMTTTLGLIFAIGVLAAGGAGFAGPSVLLASTARLTPPDKRGIASGIVNAGGSFGQFVFVPIAGAITAGFGWAVAVQSMAAIVLLALPAAWLLRGRPMAAAPAPAGQAAPAEKRETTRVAIGRAMRDPSYRLLAAGFFVCGFHVAFIATHLPGVVAACQLPPSVGAWALGIVGLFNIVGSLAMGWAGRPLAHEVAALAAVRGARRRGAAVPASRRRPKPWCWCSPPSSASPISRPCRRRRAWSPSSTAPRTWRRCSASSCCRTSSAASSAPGSAARPSRRPAATTGCGTPTSCSPPARR
jgi:MFS family permease